MNIIFRPHLLLLQPKVTAVVFGEHVVLDERVRVEQNLKSFASRQLALQFQFLS